MRASAAINFFRLFPVDALYFCGLYSTSFRQPAVCSSSGYAAPTLAIVSIVKMNACINPVNRSKYTDRTAGTPIVNTGNASIPSPRESDVSAK